MTARQLAIDPATLARGTDPETSREAARRLRARNRDAILQAIRAHGPVTYTEAGYLAGITGVEPARRISDLIRLGLVEPVLDDEGRELTRQLPSGRRGRLYRAVAA